jgi:hypothetical protein
VACIYDNWQSIFELPPDGLKAQCCIVCSPADFNHKPQYSSAAAQCRAAYTPRGAELCNLAGTPAFHIKTHPSPKSGYYNILCAEGNFSGWKPVLAARLAECYKYSNLCHLERQVCIWCGSQNNELGNYFPPDKQHPRQDYNIYQTLRDANTKAPDAELSLGHVP